MIKTITIVVLGLVVSAQALQGQDRSRYRDFQLGDNLVSVSASTKVAARDARTIHQRPALMQELEWRPPYYVSGSTALQNDPVRHIVFSFYNDQLAKIVVDYDHERTAGMTDADMVEALSATYGERVNPERRNGRGVASQVEQESGTPIARWEDAEDSLVLYRAPYGSGFRVIVTSLRLDALARTANAEAIRMDEREAPEREIARRKKDAEEASASQEKARLVNKAGFRP